MWPSADAALLASVTVTAAKSYVVLQADPRLWETGEPARGVYTAPRIPFAQVHQAHIAGDSLSSTPSAQRSRLVCTRQCTCLDTGQFHRIPGTPVPGDFDTPGDGDHRSTDTPVPQ
jgi:hypothetical protein